MNGPVALGELLLRLWQEILIDGRTEVELEGTALHVGRTRSQGLRTVGFSVEGRRFEGIEQNPLKTSRWAKMAQAGSRIMQFRCNGRYIANVADGRLTRYPSWRSMELPD